MTLTRSRPETCLSDLKLERVLSEEADAATLEPHLASCALCTARLGELRAEVAVLADDLTRVRPLRQRLKTAGVVAGALAAGFLAFTVYLQVRVNPLESDGRLKGQGFAVALVVKGADGSIARPSPGASVRPGDAVRFQVSTVRPGFVAILGVDSAGTVSLYYPDEGEGLLQLGEGRGQLLPGSVVLDETLGAELFVALRCDAQTPRTALVEKAKRALETAGGDVAKVQALQSGCDEDRFLVTKVKP